MGRAPQVDVHKEGPGPDGRDEVKTILRPVLIALLILAVCVPAVFAQENAEPDPSLVAVGSLSASNLYLSYLVLGTVADGYISGSYDDDTTKSIARETIFLNGNTRSALETLLDSDVIAPEESMVVNEMIQSYVVLDNMARALIAFVDDDEDNGAAYQVFRVEAWERISRLLDL
jgi:hypothetical protein